jgi:hypothetical protein
MMNLKDLEGSIHDLISCCPDGGHPQDASIRIVGALLET